MRRLVRIDWVLLLAGAIGVVLAAASAARGQAAAKTPIAAPTPQSVQPAGMHRLPRVMPLGIPAPEFGPRPIPASVQRLDYAGQRPSMGYFPLYCNGTPNNPTYFKFTNPDGTRQRVPYKFYIYGNYGVVEGLDAHRFEIAASNVVIQHWRTGGDANAKGGGCSIGWGADNVTMILGESSENGDWLASFDQDNHGLSIGRATDVTVLDSVFFHNSGDGVQINGGDRQADTRRIFIGRCGSWENKQAGFISKQSDDTVFSQCYAARHRPIGASPSAWGAGFGYQYGPERIWFIACESRENVFGVSTGSTSGLGYGRSAFFVSCYIHDNHRAWAADGLSDAAISARGWVRTADGLATHPGLQSAGDSWGPAGLTLVGSPEKSVIGCTIVNNDAGIKLPGGELVIVSGNIIQGCSRADAIQFDDTNSLQSAIVRGNVFWPAYATFSRGTHGRLSFEPWVSEFGAKIVTSGNMRFDPWVRYRRAENAAARWRIGPEEAAVFKLFLDRYHLDIDKDFNGRKRTAVRTAGAFE